MDTRKITLVATIVAIALLAVGIGYAYTAYSLNDSNTADTEYVTITQTKYTFGDADIRYDTNTYMDRTQQTPAEKKVYTLKNDDDTGLAGLVLGTAGTSGYYAVGFDGNNDTITAVQTGGTPGSYDVKVKTEGFIDLSTMTGWTYILVVEQWKDASGDVIESPTKQAVLFSTNVDPWAGTPTNPTYKNISNAGAITDATNLVFVDSYVYKTYLYFGTTGSDNVLTTATGDYCAQIVDIAPVNVEITDGKITFGYTSS